MFVMLGSNSWSVPSNATSAMDRASKHFEGHLLMSRLSPSAVAGKKKPSLLSTVPELSFEGT